MEQTIIQIGNSSGIIIPAFVMKQMNLKRGERAYVVLSSDKKSFTVSVGGPKEPSISTSFAEALERVNRRYGKALKELASK